MDCISAENFDHCAHVRNTRRHKSPTIINFSAKPDYQKGATENNFGKQSQTLWAPQSLLRSREALLAHMFRFWMAEPPPYRLRECSGYLTLKSEPKLQTIWTVYSSIQPPTHFESRKILVVITVLHTV